MVVDNAHSFSLFSIVTLDLSPVSGNFTFRPEKTEQNRRKRVEWKFGVEFTGCMKKYFQAMEVKQGQ